MQKIWMIIIAVAVVTFVTVYLYDRSDQQQRIMEAQQLQEKTQKALEAESKAAVDSFSKRWAVPKK